MSLIIFLFCAYLTIISCVDNVVHDFYWRDYTRGDIPRDAFEGAPGLYIGQVNTREHNTVATIYPSTGNAIAGYAGEVLIVEDDIKILSSGHKNKIYWEHVDLDKPQGQQLQDAIRGGYHNNTRDPLFIGKVEHQGEWKIGKVHTFKHNDNRGIWVWNQQQKPVNIHQFDILKYNVTAPVVIKQDFYWRDYIHGDVPYDALEVVPGKYIGQVNYEGHNKVATIYSYDGIATIEWRGRIDLTENIKILCAPDLSKFYWESVDFTKDNDRQMRDAVKGGYQIIHKIPLYIGKAYQDGEWKIGKVASITHSSKGLWIWDKNNKALRLFKFDILKYNY